MSVHHAPQIGTWFIQASFAAKSSVGNTTECGTGRYPSLDLIQDALNLKTPTVYDTAPISKSSVINVQETEAARAKLAMPRKEIQDQA